METKFVLKELSDDIDNLKRRCEIMKAALSHKRIFYSGISRGMSFSGLGRITSLYNTTDYWVVISDCHTGMYFISAIDDLHIDGWM